MRSKITAIKHLLWQRANIKHDSAEEQRLARAILDLSSADATDAELRRKLLFDRAGVKIIIPA